MEPLKIISLQAENIKRLVAVHITPEGNLVEISGNNAQGKTSVLDSIWWGLDGERNIQDDPIRHGEERALIRLDLGEIVVTRTFNSKTNGTYTTALKVEASDGSRFTNPQTMLNELLGNLTFDPLNFMKMKPKDQMEMLKTFVPDIDFKSIDEANEADFDARQDINREHKLLVARASGIDVPDDCPEKVDVQDLIIQMRDAAVHNSAIEQIKQNQIRDKNLIVDKIEQATEKTNRAIDLRFQAAELDEQCTKLNREIDNIKVTLDVQEGMPDMIDVQAMQEQLDTVNETNEMVIKAEQKAELLKEAEALKTRSDEFTKTIDTRKEETSEAIKAAKMPVDGLDFGEDCILFNDVPFNQASDAEQLKTSIMMAIVMNPTLRVIRVRDGSLLDESSMKLLADIAAKEDYQIWIERIDSSGKIGFVIEDGSLKK